MRNQAQAQAPSKHATTHASKGQDKTSDEDVPSNLEKDPADWVTGGESMTGAQASYLKTLCEEAGAEFDGSLTKAEASQRIDALREQTGRGIDH